MTPRSDIAQSVVRQFLRAVEAREREAALACLSPDHVLLDVAQGRLFRGPIPTWEALDAWHDGLDGLRVEARWLSGGGAQATVCWQIRGTHSGTFVRLPATGAEVLITGTSMLTIEAGRIARHLMVWDQAGLLRQLHLLPAQPLELPAERLLDAFLSTLPHAA